MKSRTKGIKPSLRSEMRKLHQRKSNPHSLIQSSPYPVYPPVGTFPDVRLPSGTFNGAATEGTTSKAPQPKVALTFADHLDKIDQYKGKYREALLQLLAVTYAACIAYDSTSETVKAVNKATLELKCADLKIEGKSYYQLIVKLAFGDDAKRASGFVHVIKAAKNQTPSVAPDDFIPWVNSKGGIQQIRMNLNSDGTEKTQTARTPAEINAEHISKAKDSVLNISLATIAYGQLPAIAKTGNEGECTAILRQQTDGSVVIKLVLNDSKIADSIYAAYGRTLK